MNPLPFKADICFCCGLPVMLDTHDVTLVVPDMAAVRFNPFWRTTLPSTIVAMEGIDGLGLVCWTER